MDIYFRSDGSGRLICTIESDGRQVTVTSADAAAASADLLAALSDLEETGYGECFWREATGEYRWILRKSDDHLIVVVMWSGGTLTGWQHVLRTETDPAAFAMRMRFEITSVAG